MIEFNVNETKHLESLSSAISRIKMAMKQAERQRRTRFTAAKIRLRILVLKAFEKDELPKFQQLHQRLSAGQGLPVPSLSICGHGTAEIRYTQLLGWFLDSRNLHGLGGLLAQAIFAGSFPSDDIPDFSKCTSLTEVYLGSVIMQSGKERGNSLDIMLHIGKWVLCIEQKILSSEGDNQLSRYSERLLSLYPQGNLLLFYLTPEGKDGSDDRWTPISHRDLFTRMATLLDSKDPGATAKHNLKALMWDLMLGPIAADVEWLSMFRREVEYIVKAPSVNYARLSKWFSRQGFGQTERRIILQLTEE